MQEYNSQPVGSNDPAVPQPAAAPANAPFAGGPAPAVRHITTPLADHPPFAATGPAPVPAHAPKHQGVRGTVLAALLGLSVAAGGIGGGATALTVSRALATPTATASAPAAAISQTVADENASLISELYKKVAPSVVSVETTLGSGRFSGGGAGSSIVIDSGHVLTNYHVVQGANTIHVVLQDGTSISGTVAGTAPQDDLAVIAVNLPADKVTPAVLGDSNNVEVGEEVVAIGNPFGLDHTVTAGIISAVNRNWSEGNGPVRPFIQTDTPINPGNSGGPLFNMQGQVIGINTAIESPVEGSVGVGFSIPIDRAKSLLPQLSQGSTVQRVWLGVSGVALDSELASQLNAPVQSGVLVASVTSGSPAAQAGLQGADPTTSNQLGDIITAIDGHAVSQVQDISSYLDGKKASDTVTLTILRGGQQQQVKVTLAPWPSDQQQQSNSNPNGDGNTNPFGGNGDGNTNPFGGDGSGNGNTFPFGGNGNTQP